MNIVGGFIRSFFTEHLLGKFVAVIFAGITVFLIEREINEDVVWVNGRVEVVSRNQDGQPRSGTYRVVLSPDPGVWIKDFPSDIKIRIKGPQKAEADFKGRRDIVVKVKREWAGAKDGDWVLLQHSMQSEDFAFDAEFGDVEVSILEEFTVNFDLFEDVSGVTMELEVPDDLSRNQRYEPERTKITPPTVTVHGPRSVIRRLRPSPGRQALNVKLEPSPFYTDKTSYRAVPTSDWTNGRVTLVDLDSVSVTLGLVEREPEIIDLGKLDIGWYLLDPHKKALSNQGIEIQNITSETMRADVKLRGYPEDLEQWRSQDGRDKLRSALRVVADPNSEIAETISDQRNPTIPLVVWGLPAGLEVESIEPSSIPLTIIRKKS